MTETRGMPQQHRGYCVGTLGGSSHAWDVERDVTVDSFVWSRMSVSGVALIILQINVVDREMLRERVCWHKKVS